MIGPSRAQNYHPPTANLATGDISGQWSRKKGPPRLGQMMGNFSVELGPDSI